MRRIGEDGLHLIGQGRGVRVLAHGHDVHVVGFEDSRVEPLRDEAERHVFTRLIEHEHALRGRSGEGDERAFTDHLHEALGHRVASLSLHGQQLLEALGDALSLADDDDVVELGTVIGE